MTITVGVVISVAGIVLTGFTFLMAKIWRDSETNNKDMRESLLQVNTQSHESNRKLTEEIAKLGNAVAGLNSTVLAQAKVHDDFKDSCTEHKGSVNHRLNTHGETLKKHGEDIAVIKGKIKLK